jgi:hypothetical protein
MDEVVIVGTDSMHAADIDLSTGNTYTFELPPGPYMVGCFTDRNTPRGSPGEIAKSSGMVPVALNDPDGLYVGDDLTCSGERENDTESYDLLPSTPGGEEFVRHVVTGLMPSDAVERTGYPDVPGGFVTYRIVRDTVVVGRVRFIAPPVSSQGWGSTLDLQSCTDAGLTLSHP